MKYQSDNESNKQIVSKSIISSAADEYEYRAQVDAVVSGIYPLLATNVTRKELIPYVLGNKFDIAAWKAFNSADNWLNLTVALQMAKVSVRDVTMIKQIVEQEFALLLDEARETVSSEEIILEPGQILVIKGAVHCNQVRGSTGMTVTIQG